MKYELLEIEPFGEHLIKSNDLDPVYVALTEMKAFCDDEQIMRWLLAYWCFYHCGFASWISEFDHRKYWEHFINASRNNLPAPTGGRWPRGKERRYWRGDTAVSAAVSLAENYPTPHHMVESLIPVGRIQYIHVAELVQKHYLFGPWISFKVCDMLERVLEVAIDFDQASVFMFKDPAEAALMLWRQKQKFPETATPKNRQNAIDSVVEYLKMKFNSFTAPPSHDRPIGLQEIETVLCKWKSHRNGHYPLYNDIDEITEALNEWSPHSATAKLMASVMPKNPEAV